MIERVLHFEIETVSGFQSGYNINRKSYVSGRLHALNTGWRTDVL